MSTSIVYDGYLERYANGACLAQLADLPGCFARGASPDDALQRLGAAIPAYYAWLARHDEYTPLVQGTFQVVAKESQAATPGFGTFFAPDAVPVTAEDLDWYMALLEWATDDLLAYARSMPAEVLERPDADGHTRGDLVMGPGVLLVDGLLHLMDRPDEALVSLTSDAGPLDWLERAVKLSSARVRAASEQERTHVIERDGERWSLRRVLRQAILNARMQLAALEAVPGGRS